MLPSAQLLVSMHRVSIELMRFENLDSFKYSNMTETCHFDHTDYCSFSLFGPNVSLGQPLPLIPLLPHLLYTLSFNIFYFYPLLFASSIFLLFHLFPFYQNSLTPFPG